MPISILSVQDSPDTTPFITSSFQALEPRLGLPAGTLDELFGLADGFQSYSQAYTNVANGSSSTVPADVVQAMRRMDDIIVAVNSGIERSFYTDQDQDIVALSSMMAELESALGQARMIPALFGVDTTAAGAVSSQAISYQVRQGDTLEGIAMHQLGDAERWVDIARFNDINLSSVSSDTTLDTWAGSLLDIPVSNDRQLNRDVSVIDAVVGTRALGSNFGTNLSTRTRADGSVDLEVLDHTNTLIEGLSARLETLVGTLPDMPEFGSYVPLLLGQDHGSMTDRMIEANIVTALQADARVSEVVNFRLTREGTSVVVVFQLKLFNGITTRELQASYNNSDAASSGNTF